MKKLKLENNNSIEYNILKIISHVKHIEKERGLTEKEIEEKYIHGYCSSLAEMIKHYLPDVDIILLWNCEEISHYCVAIDFVDKENFDVFDINGKKTYLEMKKFLIKEFALNEDLFCWFDQDVERENSIKEVVYATIQINEKENELVEGL